MNIKHMSSVIGIALLLAGCGTTQEYARPSASIPGVFPAGEAYSGGNAAQGVLSALDIRWADVFPDKKLQKVIVMALMNNRDLRIASLNVERARAYYGIQRAELFPSVNATAIGAKQRISEDLSTSGKAMTVEQYSVDLGIAAWEVDLFGRLRSLKAKSLQEYLATEQARRGAQTALISEVARVYFTLAADRENFKLAQSTLQGREDVHRMIRQQYDSGVVTEIDLRRSQTQVDVARGDMARYTQLVAQDRNALNLLAGGAVPEDLLPADLAAVAPPLDIAPGTSSSVLLRRPDIMAAEHQLQAASAFIDAARAAFFPRIALTTAIGTASTELSGLFNAETATWSFAPQAVLPVFDARIWAAFRVSKATREIALAQYEKAIQTAFREVADALAVRGTVDQQITAQASVVDSAKKVYELSEMRYDQGIDSYLSVLDAQRSFYAAQQGLTSLRLGRLANQVRLFAVLGGEGAAQNTVPAVTP